MKLLGEEYRGLSKTDASFKILLSLVRKYQRVYHLLIQFLIIVGFYYLGNVLALALPVKIPGNIVGMVLLLAALMIGLVKAHNIDKACSFLIDKMALFFLPAGVAIMGCFGLLEGVYLKFALICLITTVIVYAATSYTVVAVSRTMQRIQKHEN